MKRKTIKISFLSLLLGSSLVFLMSCNSDKTTVTTITSPEKPGTGTTLPILPQAPTYVFGSHFRVVNSKAYELILKNCSRCGTERLIQNPLGGSSYQRSRSWSWGNNINNINIQACSNWLYKGYLQLEFTNTTLPTTVKVLIQPLYTTGSLEHWGVPFELTTTAYAINEDEGFEILVYPNQGLRGTSTLSISSASSTPVKDTLSLNVKYGKAIIMANPVLKKYPKRSVPTPQLTCSQYSN